MGGVSILFYVGMTIVSQNVLGDSIAAVGLMIAFYYGMTGFACVWFYRRSIAKGGRDLWMKGVLPFLGGLLLLGAFGIASYQYAQPSYGKTTIFGIGGVFVIGIGALVFGGVLMLVYRVVAPAFFLGETLARRGAHDLLLRAFDLGGGYQGHANACLELIRSADPVSLGPADSHDTPEAGSPHQAETVLLD